MTTVAHLSNGKTALIDDRDADLVLRYSWHIAQADQFAERYYAVTQVQQRTIYMHRLILDAPCNLTVDHINNDGLDNRRCNLRLATRSQNNANRETTGSSGGYRGVYFVEGRYRARIWVNGRGVSLGGYDTPIAAALAYDEAASRYFGEFARLNFPASERSAAA